MEGKMKNTMKVFALSALLALPMQNNAFGAEDVAAGKVLDALDKAAPTSSKSFLDTLCGKGDLKGQVGKFFSGLFSGNVGKVDISKLMPRAGNGIVCKNNVIGATMTLACGPRDIDGFNASQCAKNANTALGVTPGLSPQDTAIQAQANAKAVLLGLLQSVGQNLAKRFICNRPNLPGPLAGLKQNPNVCVGAN